MALSAAATSLRWVLAHEHIQLTVRGGRHCSTTLYSSRCRLGPTAWAACALTVARSNGSTNTQHCGCFSPSPSLSNPCACVQMLLACLCLSHGAFYAMNAAFRVLSPIMWILLPLWYCLYSCAPPNSGRVAIHLWLNSW